MRPGAMLAFLLCLRLLAVGVGITPLFSLPGEPVYYREVLRALEEAQEEILVMLSDCRFYPEGSPVNGLLEALARAHRQGVTVRVLLEDHGIPDPETEAAYRFLEGEGVEVRWDSPDVTLHAKLLVLDHRYVVVGSSPWTYNALFKSVQADLLIEEGDVAGTFAGFFRLIWEGRFKGRVEVMAPEPPALIPLPELPGAELHHHWALRLLEGATRSISLALYKLGYYPQYPTSPSNELIAALLDAAARGVLVRVLLEGGEDYADLEFAREARKTATYLRLNGVRVRFDPTGETLHAKLLVVDGEDIMVSSANWSYYSLARNVEAGVVILGAPELGELSQRFFLHLWHRAASTAEGDDPSQGHAVIGIPDVGRDLTEEG